MGVQNIFENLKKFINKETLVDKIKITRMTNIERDLGITGDDAWDFLEKYGNKFKVDISNFDFNKSFQEEGSWVFGWVLNIFSNKNSTRQTLTVGQLEEAVKIGKLE